MNEDPTKTHDETAETDSPWKDRLSISKEQWDNEPGVCALKLCGLAVAIALVGELAPLVALVAGAVAIGKLVSHE